MLKLYTAAKQDKEFCDAHFSDISSSADSMILVRFALEQANIRAMLTDY